jgi:hypothetical protein
VRTGIKREEVDDRENYIMRSVKICSLQEILLRCRNKKKNVMSRAWSTTWER